MKSAFCSDEKGIRVRDGPTAGESQILEHLLGYFHLSIFMNARRTFPSYPLHVLIVGLQY
jgi:hypothetical protein